MQYAVVRLGLGGFVKIKTEKPSASKPVKPENRFFPFNFYFN
jgi:hypothetical protein